MAGPQGGRSSRESSGDAPRRCKDSCSRPDAALAVAPAVLLRERAMPGTYLGDVTGELRAGLWGSVAVSLLAAVDGSSGCGRPWDEPALSLRVETESVLSKPFPASRRRA